MGRRRKNLHYGTKALRTSVPDRTSKAARPWNDPRVVDASMIYGVPLASYKQVHMYENRQESTGGLTPEERMTCGPCGQFKNDCACGGEQPNEQQVQ